MKYTPFLRNKRGELRALRELPESVREELLPLFIREDPGEPIGYDHPHLAYPSNTDANRNEVHEVFHYEPGATYPDESVIIIGADDLDSATIEVCDTLHVIVDVGDLSQYPIPALRYQRSAAIALVRNLQSCREITITGTSAPQSMAGIDRGITRQPRLEWALFQSIAAEIDREIGFGDYTTRHPESPTEWAPYMKPGAKIRYTGEEDIVILKGGSLHSGDGYEQFHALAEQLMHQPEYSGESYSWGDHQIAECARRASGPGSQETWISNEVNHHITLVMNQLATLHDA